MKQTRKIMSPTSVTVGIRRRRRDHRHAVFLANRRAHQRQARGHFAQHGHNVVARDEPRDRRARLAGIALVVVGDDANLLAVDAAGLVDFIDGQPDAVVGRSAKGRLGAGHRRVMADDNFVGTRLSRNCNRSQSSRTRQPPAQRRRCNSKRDLNCATTEGLRTMNRSFVGKMGFGSNATQYIRLAKPASRQTAAGR